MKEFEIAQKIGKPLTDAQFREAAAKALGVKPEKVGHVEVTRRSIDARQDILYRYRVQAYRDNEPYEPYRVAPYLAVHQARPVIVVGAGPAGMFAALKLLQLGLKPIVLDGFQLLLRGRRCWCFQRWKAVHALFQAGRYPGGAASAGGLRRAPGHSD